MRWSPHVLSKVTVVAAGHLPCYTPATKASMVDCTSEETDTSFIYHKITLAATAHLTPGWMSVSLGFLK